MTTTLNVSINSNGTAHRLYASVAVMKEKMMARPTQTQVALAREEERLRAIEIVHAVYGGHPKDTIAYYQYAKAITLIKGEEKNERV